MRQHQTVIDDSDSTPQEREHWKSLGRFIEIFSMAETAMQLALRHYSKVKDPVAQVLFSGTRVDAASNQIKRIAEARPWSAARRKRLDTICAQLGVITQTRNDILHYGAFRMKDGSHRVSNALFAHIPSRLRETRITNDALDRMSVDLVTIIAQMEILRKGDKAHAFYREMKMPPENAWLYKPEISQGPPKKRRRRNPKPEGPLQASQA
jgi:hypothetical protein